jgi:2-C-methyl-D-erythritol 4-phosphate cytidylyltransferase
VWTVIVAAGSSSRFGTGAAKQYEPLAGRRVVDWSIDAARSVSDGLVLVVAEAYSDLPEPAVDAVVLGGPERSDSVRAGLAVVPDSAEVIVVHDAARPLATSALFVAVVGTVGEGVDGAIPGEPPLDTIKHVGDDHGRTVVVSTLDRANLRAVQTPQAFRASALRRAHAGGGQATDDAALVESVGGTVVVVDGDRANIKITHPADLAYAEHLLRGR